MVFEFEQVLSLLSTYELLCCILLTENDQELCKQTEGIYNELRNRSGRCLPDDIDQWISWFLSLEDSHLTVERASIQTMYRIYKAERTALNKLKKGSD